MYPTRSFTQYLVTLFSLTIFFVNAIFIFQDNFQTKSWIYYTVIFSLLALGSIISFLKSPLQQKEKRFSAIEYLGLLFLVLINAVIIIQNYSHHTFWLDEYTHAIFADENPATGASLQQQPILGYLLSKLLTTLFGYKIFSIRIFGIAPYLVAIVLTGLWGLRLRGGLAFLILFASLTATNGVLNYTALEGRSVALALMSLSVMLHAWLEHQKCPHIWNSFFLVTSSFLFMTSVGLQTWLVVLTLASVQLALWLLTYEKKWLSSSLSLLISFILYLPILIFLTLVAKTLSYTQEHPFARILQLPINLKTEFFMFYIPNHQLFTALVIATFLGITYFKYQKNKSEKNYWLLGFSFYVIFPLIYIWTSHLFIKWFTHEWYRASYLFLVITLISLGISRLNPKMAIITSLVVSTLLWSSDTRFKTYKSTLNIRLNWERLYDEVSQDELMDKRIYITGTCNIMSSWWCNNLFVGAEFLAPAEGIENIPSRQSNWKLKNILHLEDNGMINDFKHPFEGKKKIITIVLNADEDTSWIDAKKTQTNADFKIKKFENFIIIESLIPMEARAGITGILKWAIQNFPADIQNFYFYELLIRISVLDGKNEVANKLFKQLTSLPGFQEATKPNTKGAHKVDQLQKLIDQNNI